LGLNAFHGDSAACLLSNGEIVAAAEEERFRRIKHWAGFPSEAIRFCLESASLDLKDIDVIAINSDSSFARSEKVKFLLSGQASMALLKEKLFVRKKRASIAELLAKEYDAVVVSIDGFGDFSSAAWGVGSASNIDIKQRVYFPHSMGVFYQALTQYLGFHNYGDEYKVMGLAPYGELNYLDELLHLG